MGGSLSTETIFSLERPRRQTGTDPGTGTGTDRGSGSKHIRSDPALHGHLWKQPTRQRMRTTKPDILVIRPIVSKVLLWYDPSLASGSNSVRWPLSSNAVDLGVELVRLDGLVQVTNIGTRIFSPLFLGADLARLAKMEFGCVRTNSSPLCNYGLPKPGTMVSKTRCSTMTVYCPPWSLVPEAENHGQTIGRQYWPNPIQVRIALAV